MRELPQRLALRQAQRLAGRRRLQPDVELTHEHEARAVVDLPQRGDHRGWARVEEGALEADEVVTARELAEAGLAGREHDEPSVEIEAKQLPHLDPPVLAVARGEEHP